MGVSAGGERIGRFDRPDDVTHFYRAYSRDVRRLAERIYRRSDADDIVQETFIIVGLKLDSIPVGKERAWVLGVARNMVRNSRRARERFDRFTGALAVVLPKLVDGINSDRPSAEVIDALGHAFAHLSRTDQEILLLCAWHELEPAEIAVVLGIRPDRASDRLYKARKRIRERYEREVGE